MRSPIMDALMMIGFTATELKQIESSYKNSVRFFFAHYLFTWLIKYIGCPRENFTPRPKLKSCIVYNFEICQQRISSIVLGIRWTIQFHLHRTLSMMMLLDFNNYWHLLKQQLILPSIMLCRRGEESAFAFINVLPN